MTLVKKYNFNPVSIFMDQICVNILFIISLTEIMKIMIAIMQILSKFKHILIGLVHSDIFKVS